MVRCLLSILGYFSLIFVMNIIATTWGCVGVPFCRQTASSELHRINSSFGVFLSFYSRTECGSYQFLAWTSGLLRALPVFPGATDVDFAFIGGLSFGCAMAVAPLANYLSKRYSNFKVPLWVGLIVYIVGQVLAGLSTKIWELFLTQGLLFGIGMGLVSAKRLLANNTLNSNLTSFSIYSCTFPRRR